MLTPTLDDIPKRGPHSAHHPYSAYPSPGREEGPPPPPCLQPTPGNGTPPPLCGNPSPRATRCGGRRHLEHAQNHCCGRTGGVEKVRREGVVENSLVWVSASGASLFNPPLKILKFFFFFFNVFSIFFKVTPSS